ncbi:MAG: hypothetical protein NTX45_25450 [Proteobacteria bacterium]|nr:hypothetical protein [Pseudomonadota bacterium]
MTDVVLDGLAELEGNLTTEKDNQVILYSSYLLQLVMHRLWNEEKINWNPSGDTPRTIQINTFTNILSNLDVTYPPNIEKSIDGKSVYRIVQDHVYGKLNKLEDKEKDIAASIFHYMVTASGYSVPQNANDLVYLANEYLDLFSRTHISYTDIKELLESLSTSECRILRRLPQGRYEAYHRSLSLQLLEWSNRQMLILQMEKSQFQEVDRLAEKSFRNFELKNYRYSLLLALEALKIQKDGKKPNPLAIMAMLQAQWMFPNYHIADEQPTDNQQEVILSAFSSDKKWLVTAGKEGSVNRYNLSYCPYPKHTEQNYAIREKIIDIWKAGENITVMAITNDGQWFACGYQNGTVQLMESNNRQGEFSTTTEQNIGKVTALAICTNPPCLISGHEYGKVLRWTRGNDALNLNQELINHSGSVRLLTMSPNGTWLISAGADKSTFFYERKGDDYKQVSASPLLESPIASVTTAVAFSEQSDNVQWLCVGQENGEVYAYQIGKLDSDRLPETIPVYRLSSRIRCIAIDYDRRWLAAGGDDELVRVWDLGNFDIPPLVLHGHESAVISLSFDKLKKNTLLTAGKNGSLFIWDLTNPTFPVESAEKVDPAFVFKHHTLEDEILAVAFCEGEKSQDNSVNIAKIGLALVTNKNPFQFHCLDLVNKETIVLNPNLWGIHRITVSSELMAMDTCKYGDILCYDINNICKNEFTPKFYSVKQQQSNIEFVNARLIAISPDEQWLFTSYQKSTPYSLWKLGETIEPAMPTMQGDRIIIRSAAFSKNSQWLIIGGERYLEGKKVGFLQVLNLRRGNPEPYLLEPTDSVIRCVSLIEDSSNSYELITCGDDAQLRLWKLEDDLRNFKNILTLNPDSRAIHTLAVVIRQSNMDTWLAVGGSDGTVCLYKNPLTQNENAKPTHLLTGHVRGDDVHFNLMFFSANGGWLFSCNHRGNEPSACLWKLDELSESTDAKLIHPIRLRGHKGYLRAAAFSPNQEWLATAGDDGRVRLWNLPALGSDPSTPPIVIRPHPIHRGINDFTPKNLSIWAIAFCRDRLVTAGDDGTARLWNLGCLVNESHPFTQKASLEKLKEKAENVVGRNMTFEEWRECFGDKEYEKTCQQLPVHESVIRDKFSRAKKFIRDSDKEKDKDKHREAENLYQQVIEWLKESTDVDLICAIGRWGCVNGFHEIALELCDQVVELKPDRVGCQDNKILALAMSGKYPEAAKYLENKISSMDDEGIMPDQVHFGKRSTWLEQLNNDKNPFTLVNLMKLGEQDMDKISYSHLSLNKEYYFWDKSNNNA